MQTSEKKPFRTKHLLAAAGVNRSTLKMWLKRKGEQIGESDTSGWDSYTAKDVLQVGAWGEVHRIGIPPFHERFAEQQKKDPSWRTSSPPTVELATTLEKTLLKLHRQTLDSSKRWFVLAGQKLGSSLAVEPDAIPEDQLLRSFSRTMDRHDLSTFILIDATKLLARILGDIEKESPK